MNISDFLQLVGDRQQERQVLAQLLEFARANSQTLAEMLTRMDRIEKRELLMDTRLADIFGLAQKEGVNIDTISAEMITLESEFDDLKAKQAAADPNDSTMVDNIKTQMVANVEKQAKLLALFNPKPVVQAPAPVVEKPVPAEAEVPVSENV